MQTEYVIWGKAPNKEFEEPLLTKLNGSNITNKKDAETMLEVLRNKHNCTDLRIQAINFNNDISNLFKQVTK